MLAQTDGTISGVVKDQSGGLIPGADITLTNESTNVVKKTISNDQGFYLFSKVPVGVYSVEAELSGFSKAKTASIKVDVRSNRKIDLILQVGDVSTQIEVQSSSVAQVELRNSEIANLISGEQVVELPLNGRSFVQLSLLVPGASAQNNSNTRNTGLFAGVDISFSGGTSTSNMWLVDGTNNVDLGSGRTILTYPSVDSIAEFKISRNMYDAAAAASSGAQINVVTKSGTNGFHGTIYEFYRGSALNATDFFLNSAGRDKQPLVYNNFGYTVGGPIVKDKAFFFWSQEWRKERRGVPRSHLVPTLLEKQGDFSGPNSRGYPNPKDPLTGDFFPGHQIPADRLSPGGLALLQLYPDPTLALDDPRFKGLNWIEAPSTPIDTRQEQFRGDWAINGQHSIMGRLTLDSWANSSPSFIEGGLWGDDPFPAVDSNWNQPGRSLTTQWTATYGSNKVNQLSFSWAGNEIDITRGAGDSVNNAITSAIPEIHPGPEGHAHASVWNTPTGGFPLSHQAPWQNEQNLFIWKNDFSWVKGNHSYSMGVLVSRNAKNEDALNNGQAYSPAFWGDGSGLSADPGWNGVPGSLGTTNNGIADRLLRGTAFWGGDENSTNIRALVRWEDLELYFADTWRVKPTFTINYGVRWSWLPNAYLENDQFGNFVLGLYDPAEGSTASNGMIFAEGCDVCPFGLRGIDVDPRSLVQNHKTNFAPRLGIAWDPTGDGTWSIRAGGGIFFNRQDVKDTLSSASNPPFNIFNFWGNARYLDSIPDSTPIFGGEGVAQNGRDLEHNTPGSYQWNLSVERELWKDTKVEVAYVANRSHHIPIRLLLNQVPVANRRAFAQEVLSGNIDGANAQFRPLFPLVGSGNSPQIFSWSADSWYHSFQAYLVKRFSNRLSYQMSYTWSKLLAIGNNVDVSNQVLSDQFNPGYDKALASFDRPHMFNANFIYRTPGLNGQNGWVRGLLGDWETSMIFTANSGVPESVFCCQNFTGTQSNRPDWTGDTSGPKTVDQWFNTSAFSPPEFIGDLGNSPRGQVRGPGILNFDFAFMKNVPGIPWFTQEGASLQFRAEMFNAFNHTQFQSVDLGFGFTQDVDVSTGRVTGFQVNNPTFGQVNSMREAREIQFGLKIIW